MHYPLSPPAQCFLVLSWPRPAHLLQVGCHPPLLLPAARAPLHARRRGGEAALDPPSRAAPPPVPAGPCLQMSGISRGAGMGCCGQVWASLAHLVRYSSWAACSPQERQREQASGQILRQEAGCSVAGPTAAPGARTWLWHGWGLGIVNHRHLLLPRLSRHLCGLRRHLLGRCCGLLWWLRRCSRRRRHLLRLWRLLLGLQRLCRHLLRLRRLLLGLRNLRLRTLRRQLMLLQACSTGPNRTALSAQHSWRCSSGGQQ